MNASSSFRDHPALPRVLAVTLLLTGLIGMPAGAQISEGVQNQIREIAAMKRSFTPAEQKMSFNLVLLSRAAHHKLPADLSGLVDRSTLDGSGRATVEVHGFMTARLLGSTAMRGVEKENGQVAQHVFTNGRVRAHVALGQLLDLAASSDVTWLSDPDVGQTNAGSITSQGYISEGANKAVALGVTGAGVRVGVMSDSALPAQVSTLIASGDLPADVTIVPGQQGATTGENEGTAMMEIVHDMAPDAKLFFATAASGVAGFAANIRTLRFTYHCDIIVDDYTYFNEGAFQDDLIAKAVNDVTADGALYVSSAANSGNLSSGTSGTWEGDFLPGIGASGLLAGAGTLHNFGTAASPVYSDVITGASTYVTLKWSDPLNGSANDYDLYVLNAGGTAIIKTSAAAQTGTQSPVEAVSGTFPVGSQVVAVLYDGNPRALRIDTNRGRLAIGTAGSTFGHNAGSNTFTTAAVYWNSAHTGVRPFVGGSANPIETFSSDGPRKIFFNPDGTPITPGNFLFATSGGTTLQKPDAAGSDGGITRTALFNPFFGTSAGAPHVAGVAALVKSANPNLTNTQIRNILTSTTIDNMAAGVDRDSGYGIVLALPAVQAAQALAAASAVQP